MVSKCLEPDCRNLFRYFGQGKLVVRKLPPTADKTHQLYWICDDCVRRRAAEICQQGTDHQTAA